MYMGQNALGFAPEISAVYNGKGQVDMILTNHTTSFFFVWKLISDAHQFWNEHRFGADFPN